MGSLLINGGLSVWENREIGQVEKILSLKEREIKTDIFG